MAASESLKRDVIVVYDGRWEASPALTTVHMRAEFPLNHLGYRIVYHDLSHGLPDPAMIGSARAVLSWLTSDLDDPVAYLTWLNRVSDQGVKVLILGSIGAPVSAQTLHLANRVLARIGLRLTGVLATVTLDAKVATLDPALMEFERRIDPVPSPHVVVERAGTTARVALEYALQLEGRAHGSVVAATGPGGGYVASGFILQGDGPSGVARWVINPFAFFEEALGRPFFPVPDTTTVSGRRLYFSHVDGEGWSHPVQVDGARARRTLPKVTPVASADPAPPADQEGGGSRADRERPEGMTGAEMMLRELIAPYPDLPVSVGFIAGEADEAADGARAVEVARRIYAQPQVEAASHTYTLPYAWDFFAHYDRDREREIMIANERRREGGMTGFLRTIGLARDGRSQHTRFLVDGTPAPRSFWREPFSIEREVTGAVRVTAALVPPARTVGLYLWSGDARPFEGIVRATRLAGLRNLNGGTTRLDAQNPSIASLAPIARPVGAERQIYAVDSSEDAYTNQWTAHFHGFRQLRDTLDRTELPVRLKGANVHYHVYSAERRASLDAVRAHLDWARTAPLAPIKASEYAAIADGFFSTRIERTGENAWTIADRDGLHTVRFDRAADLVPDIGRSVGVVGSNGHAGSLYVALDPAVASAHLVLRRRSDEARPTFAKASLRESRWQVRDLRRDTCRIRLEAEGYGDGTFSWEGVPPGDVLVAVRKDGRDLLSMTAAADPQGRLAFTLPVAAYDPVAIEIGCAVRQ